MTHLLIGFVFLFIRIVSAGGDDMNSCLDLFNPEGVDKMCCETLESFDKMSDEYDECLEEDSEEWMCEDFQCILNKTGMFKEGKIDEDGANKFYDDLEAEYPKEEALIERIRRECLNGKYATYPPEDSCPAVKFFVCSYINTYLECDSWKDIEVCSKMAENAKKCKAALDN